MLLSVRNDYLWENLYRLKSYVIIVTNKYFSGLGEKVRDFGGRVYDVCSFHNLKKGGLVGLALGVGAMSSACLTPQGNRFGQGLVKDYVRASVVREAQNQSDANYAHSYNNSAAQGRKVYQSGNDYNTGFSNDAAELLRRWNSGQSVVIPCNGWRDYNRDGMVSSNEIVGIKNYFSRHEPIEILIKVVGEAGKPLRVAAVANQDHGSFLANAMFGGDQHRTAVIDSINSNNFLHRLGHDIGTGSFAMNFYAGQDYIGSASYVVR